MPLYRVLLQHLTSLQASTALLCTHLHRRPSAHEAWFLRCWQVEITFQVVHPHT